MYWARRLVLIAVLGYAIGEVGLLLGLSDIAHDALEKGVGLVLHLCLAYVVVRNRRAVRRWIRAPEGSAGMIARLRNRFAADLALGRAVPSGRRLAGLGDRGAARLRRGPALPHRHRPRTDCCSPDLARAAGDGGPVDAAGT